LLSSALAVVAAALALQRLRRVEVVGPSMIPTLSPGDRLIVVRGGRLAPGDLVAVRDPERPSRLLVKRLSGIGPQGALVEGDNPAASRDSRHFGPVPLAAVVGRAVYRYHPAADAAALRRGRGPSGSPREDRR
jgi:nickel-type superoxide dismutase maturation protease